MDDIKNFIQQKLIEKCNREGISIDQVILFFPLSNFRSKTFLQTKHVIYQSLHMLLAGLKGQLFKSKRLSLLSLCILKKKLIYKETNTDSFFTQI